MVDGLSYCIMGEIAAESFYSVNVYIFFFFIPHSTYTIFFLLFRFFYHHSIYIAFTWNLTSCHGTEAIFVHYKYQNHKVYGRLATSATKYFLEIIGFSLSNKTERIAALIVPQRN